MVQMLALQRVYVFSQRKEYPEGATFSISDTREADSLRLMKKARIFLVTIQTRKQEVIPIPMYPHLKLKTLKERPMTCRPKMI